MWNLLETAFGYAGSREAAVAEADRILRKTFPELPVNYICEASCIIKFERLTREALDRLHLRHKIDTPNFGGGTIVIVEHLRERHVVDGTKRINRWKNHGITETDAAVVIARKQ